MRGAKQDIPDCFEHTFQVYEHVPVREAEDAPTLALKPVIASRIASGCFTSGVGVAIEFDPKFRPKLGEVEDVGSTRKLSPEFGIVELATAQMRPETPFSRRCLPSQDAGSSGC